MERVIADSVERLSFGRARVTVAARQGLGVVVVVRGHFAPTVVTLRPDDAAIWSAGAALWIDATRARRPESPVLRSQPTSTPGSGLFLERAVIDGRPTLALYAVDSSATRGTVLELTEAELRDVLTSIWSVASERDSALLAPERIGTDTVWSESRVTRLPRPRPTKSQPHYPEKLIRNGVHGGVALAFVIDTSGAVPPATIEVLDASRAEFRDAVLAFVHHLSFEPAEVAGRRVAMRVLMPFGFYVGREPELVKFDVVHIDERRPPPEYSSP